MKFDASKYFYDTVMHCSSFQEVKSFLKYVHDSGIDGGEIAHRATVLESPSISIYIHELALQVFSRYGDRICIRFSCIDGYPDRLSFGYGSIQNYRRSGYLILEYSDFEWEDSDAEAINFDNTEIQNFLMSFIS